MSCGILHCIVLLKGWKRKEKKRKVQGPPFVTIQKNLLWNVVKQLAGCNPSVTDTADLPWKKKNAQKIYTFSALKRAGIHDGENLWQNVWARSPAVQPGRAGAKSPKTTLLVLSGSSVDDFSRVDVSIQARASFGVFDWKLKIIPVKISSTVFFQILWIIYGMSSWKGKKHEKHCRGGVRRINLPACLLFFPPSITGNHDENIPPVSGCSSGASRSPLTSSEGAGAAEVTQV